MPAAILQVCVCVSVFVCVCVCVCVCVFVCITNVRIVKSVSFVCLLLVPNHFQVCCGQYNKNTKFGQCHGQYSSAHRI